jgi:hypothetical protein
MARRLAVSNVVELPERPVQVRTISHVADADGYHRSLPVWVLRCPVCGEPPALAPVLELRSC